MQSKTIDDNKLKEMIGDNYYKISPLVNGNVKTKAMKSIYEVEEEFTMKKGLNSFWTPDEKYRDLLEYIHKKYELVRKGGE